MHVSAVDRRVGLLWAIVAIVTTAAAGAAQTEVKLGRVRYPQLVEVIRQQKNHVLIVDFWSTSCLPCLKELPHVVALNNKFEKLGLRVITVTLDKAEHHERALRHLQMIQATMINLLLDEEASSWQHKIPLRSIPCIYVFDRQGKIERKIVGAPDHDELEKLLRELLRD